MSEQLSALIDNELDDVERARVLNELSREAHLAELWSRYHIIGLAMRQERISWGGDLPERVAWAVDSKSVAATGAEAPGRQASWFRPASGLAIAASVVAVLLVGGLILNLYEDTLPHDAVAPVGQQVALDSNAMRWDGVDPQVEDELNALLVEHGEFTAASGMNGLAAYTKFVAYDSR